MKNKELHKALFSKPSEMRLSFRQKSWTLIRRIECLLFGHERFVTDNRVGKHGEVNMICTGCGKIKKTGRVITGSTDEIWEHA